jgi:dephospho-CoA kinase
MAREFNKHVVIGLTGSIGMGKSTATKILRDMGYPVHDSDAAAHELLKKDSPAYSAIVSAFGSITTDQGDIDRQQLGAIVFNNPEKMQQLESILHPLIQSSADRFVEEMSAQGHHIIFLDIPLLFEVGRDKDMDYSLVVTTSPEIQKQRVLSRPNMTQEKFNAILAKQMPDSEKRQKADFVIHMEHGLDQAKQDLLKTIKIIEKNLLKP